MTMNDDDDDDDNEIGKGVNDCGLICGIMLCYSQYTDREREMLVPLPCRMT